MPLFVAIGVGGYLLSRRARVRRAAEPTSPYEGKRRIKAAEATTRRLAAEQTQAIGQVGAVPGARARRVGSIVFTLGSIAVAVTAIIAYVTTVVRKPCQECDVQTYDESVENLIVQALLVAAVAMAAALILLTIGSVIEQLGTRRWRQHHLRMAAAPYAGANRPDEKTLLQLLTDAWPLRLACLGLAFWVVAVFWFGVAATREAAAGQPPFVGVTWWPTFLVSAVLLGLLVVLETYAAHERREVTAVVRRAWPVVEPGQAADG